MQDPTNELQRIQNELVKCGLPQKPIETEAVSSFFDKKLVHHSKENAASHEIQKTNQFHGPVVTPFMSWMEKKMMYDKAMEKKMYDKAMEVYHDLESGEAFEEDYVWPILP